MIGLDNGPSDGDYVRYIERLITGAKNAPTAAAPPSAPVFGQAPAVPPGGARAGLPASPSTPKVAGTTSAKTSMPSTTASVPARTAPLDPALIRAIGTSAVGFVLLVASFLSTPIHAFLLLIGLFTFAAGTRLTIRSIIAGAKRNR